MSEFMDFSEALDALKEGQKIARNGWNGKGMYLILVPGTVGAQIREGSPYAAGPAVADIGAHIDMWTAQGNWQPGWLASQSDMLAEDWIIV